MFRDLLAKQSGRNAAMERIAGCCAVLVVFVAGAFVSGCSTKVDAKPEPESTIESELTRSVGGVQSLLRELVLLERSRSGGEPYRAAVDSLPKEDPLQKRDSLVWIGDARTVVSKIATMAGLEFSVEGKSAVSLIVAIDMRDRPLVSMLESVGAQIGQVAQIAYDPAGASLVLRYRN